MVEVEQIRAKYARLRGVMGERVTRLWAATEAEALGYGGIATVVEATGSASRGSVRPFETWPSRPSIPPRVLRAHSGFDVRVRGGLRW
jgi:hypothetical protein